MLRDLRDEIEGIRARDPAVRSTFEIITCYPSFHAMRFYRLARWFWVRKLFWLGRYISQWGRFWTGIEIHPGAKIGKRFFVDHGGGVVIGEFSEIGDDVTLYQGVTLGGVSPSENSSAQAGTKRHPTLEDQVIVGSGAQILGNIVVGQGARVGANSVVVRDVACCQTVAGIPARQIGAPKPETKSPSFAPYGITPDAGLEEIAESPEKLRGELGMLKARINALETALESARSQDASPKNPVTREAQALQAPKA